jgi:hypothetical protein
VTRLPECQFYITDLCGLSCQGCITYNDRHWGQHIALTEEIRRDLDVWSQHVTFDTISVLGGEPLMHPDLAAWLELIQALWPKVPRWITTNGVRLLDLHDSIRGYLAQGWCLEVSAHTPELYQRLSRDLAPALELEYLPWDSGCFELLDTVGRVRARVVRSTEFHTQPWQWQEGEVTWPQGLGDPDEQWLCCPARTCHYMIGSRLYACPQQALLPRISAQGRVTAQHRLLASEDWGLTVADQDRVHELQQPRNQCGFCDWSHQRQHTLTPMGSKLIPLTQIR